MTKWRDKSRWPPEQERERQRMIEEARRDEEYRKRLQVIKDKLDLYGEEALTPEEKDLVKRHHDFFYPGEE